MNARGIRPGVTLVELLVVLAILGLSLGVVAVAAPPLAESDTWSSRDGVSALRRAALASGRDTTALLSDGSAVMLVTAMRDGRVVTSNALLPVPDGGRDGPR